MTPEQAAKSRTAKSWVERAATVGSQQLRKNVIRYWVIGNLGEPVPQRLPEDLQHPTNLRLYGLADALISEIREEKLDLYETAEKMVRDMKARAINPSQIHHFRVYLKQFLRYTKLNPDEDEYNDVVTKVANYKINTNETPDSLQIRKLLSNGNPKTKGITYVMLCTFRRINEVIQLRLADVNLETLPATARYRHATTKTNDEITCLLSREAADYLRTYLKNRRQESPWLFPAQHDPKEHITRDGAGAGFRIAFRNANLLTRTETGKRFTLSPRTLRTASMAIAKANGFPADWTEILAGHTTGTQRRYLPELKIYSKVWMEKVEPHLNFLTNPTDQPVEEFNRRITQLEEQLKEANLDRSITIATFKLLTDLRQGSDTKQSAAQLVATMREAVPPSRQAEFDNEFTAKWKEILLQNPNAPMSKLLMNMAYPISAMPITVKHQEN